MTVSLSVSCVILTQGDRPAQLARAIDSLRRQHGQPVEVVLVLNGVDEVEAPAESTVVKLSSNAGIPGGRNAGTQSATGQIVIYLDDDGWLPDANAVEKIRTAFHADPNLAVVSFRIIDPDTAATERRHVPRLRTGDPERSSYVTTFLGGACAIRRAAYDECGAFPNRFFYGHEESDFAWRAIDAGYRIRYDAGIRMYHPAVHAADRHDAFYYYNARNRVWLARRGLPWPVNVLYVMTWMLITAVREPRISALRRWCAGLWAGIRDDAGARRPISWRTVLRMIRLGRPPIV